MSKDEKKPLLWLGRKMLPVLLLLVILGEGYFLIPYLWPYPDILKRDINSQENKIVITGTMLPSPSDDLKSIGRLKIDRIIKNTSDVVLTENQTVSITARLPPRQTSCLGEFITWPHIEIPRQRRKIGDQGILYAVYEKTLTNDNTPMPVLREVAFHTDNIVKRMLLQHFEQERQKQR